MAIGMDDAEFRVKAKRYGPLLKVLADAISFLNEQRFNHIRPENEIKPKALRLLSTMAKCDLSLAEAADDLCISLDTANKHMALAKQAAGDRISGTCGLSGNKKRPHSTVDKRVGTDSV